jgi:hypothetical protein
VDDAVGVGRDRGDDRDPAGLDDVEDRLRPDVGDLPDQAEVDLLAVHDGGGPLGREEPGVLPGQPHGERPVAVDEPHQLPLHLPDEDHADDIHRLLGGDPQAAAELRGDAEPVEHGRDLRPATVHDDRLEAGVPQEHDVLRERRLEGVVGHGVAAVLHDDRPAVVLHQPRQRLGERGGLVGRPLPRLLVGHGVFPALSCCRRSSRARRRA